MCIGTSLLLCLLEGKEHFSLLKSPCGIRSCRSPGCLHSSHCQLRQVALQHGWPAQGTFDASLFTQLLSRTVLKGNNNILCKTCPGVRGCRNASSGLRLNGWLVQPLCSPAFTAGCSSVSLFFLIHGCRFSFPTS